MIKTNGKESTHNKIMFIVVIANIIIPIITQDCF